MFGRAKESLEATPWVSAVDFDRRLRRRLAGHAWLRYIALLSLCLASLFVAIGLLVPPVIGWAGAAIAWGAILLPTLWLAVRLRPRSSELRKAADAGLGRQSEGLASRLRSAIELAEGLPAGASPELSTAHAHSVAAALRGLRLEDLAPWEVFWPRTFTAAVAAGAVLLGGAATLGVGRSGRFALLHPSSAERSPFADVVASVEYEVRFPAYLQLAAETLQGDRLELPAGSMVEVRARTLSNVDALSLRIGEASIPLNRTADDPVYRGRFEAIDGGVMRFVARVEGNELRDARQRELRILWDAAPELAFDTSGLDLDLDAVPRSAELTLPYGAVDDHGIHRIDLVVRSEGGEVLRRELFRSPLAEPMRQGVASLAIAELRARPGDVLHVFLEGFDAAERREPSEATEETDENGNSAADAVTPGRSPSLRLTLETARSRRAQAIARLDELVEAGVTALAEQLEETEARRPTLSTFITLLRAVANEGHQPIDGSVLASMARRLSGLRRRAPALIERLETDVLFLADLAASVRRQDAADLVRELDVIRREMRSLLEELRRTDSPAAREELLAALARARRRIGEIQSRLASRDGFGPGEFTNPSAAGAAAESAGDSLSRVASALREGDLDAAERALMELEREIGRMGAEGEDSMGFGGSGRPSPRQLAMAEAMDRLAGLETEQRQLGTRTDRTRSSAAEAALEAGGGALADAARRLAERAETAGESLRAVPAQRLGRFDRETRELAIARLEDAQRALEMGDLGEARSMTEAAQRNAERLARELELSALMYPGRNGETADAAEAARSGARATSELGATLDDALPRVGDFVDDAGSAQLRGDRPRQDAAADAARDLAELFRSEPGGQPLSPDGAEAVASAGEAMGEALRAMGRQRPLEASRAQNDAARILSELRDKLEQQQQQEQGGGGGGASQRERVEVPGRRARDDDRRRQLLDALGRGSPEGFEEANSRYYEGLLR